MVKRDSKRLDCWIRTDLKEDIRETAMSLRMNITQFVERVMEREIKYVRENGKLRD